jgi:ABC-2 type transport system permease protein
MRGLYRILAGTWAFLFKETIVAVQQPRLLLTVIVGPFLLLLIFALGFTDNGKIFDTVLVVPSRPGVPTSLPTYRNFFFFSLRLVGVTTDETAALNRLRAGQIDAVVVAPADPLAALASDQPAEFQVYFDSLSPVEQQQLNGLVYAHTRELNTLVVAAMLSGVFQAAGVPQSNTSAVTTLQEALLNGDSGGALGEIDRLLAVVAILRLSGESASAGATAAVAGAADGAHRPDWHPLDGAGRHSPAAARPPDHSAGGAGLARPSRGGGQRLAGAARGADRVYPHEPRADRDQRDSLLRAGRRHASPATHRRDPRLPFGRTRAYTWHRGALPSRADSPGRDSAGQGAELHHRRVGTGRGAVGVAGLCARHSLPRQPRLDGGGRRSARRCLDRPRLLHRRNFTNGDAGVQFAMLVLLFAIFFGGIFVQPFTLVEPLRVASDIIPMKEAGDVARDLMLRGQPAPILSLVILAAMAPITIALAYLLMRRSERVR